jgi:hypothetical protein
MEKGTKVWDREGKEAGKATGGEPRFCGCCGSNSRIGVRWPDKSLTFPCLRGLKGKGKKALQII